MSAEKVKLFKPEEVALITSELLGAAACHQSVRNLIRRSLTINGELIKPNILKRVVLGRGIIVTNEAGGYNKTDNKGFTTYPVGEFDGEALPQELKEAFESVFGAEDSKLELYATHETYYSFPAVSIVSLYVKALEEGEPTEEDEEGEEDITSLRAVCNGPIIEADMSINGRIARVGGERGFKLASQLIQFANDRLDAHLEELRSGQTF